MVFCFLIRTLVLTQVSDKYMKVLIALPIILKQLLENGENLNQIKLSIRNNKRIIFILLTEKCKSTCETESSEDLSKLNLDPCLLNEINCSTLLKSRDIDFCYNSLTSELKDVTIWDVLRSLLPVSSPLCDTMANNAYQMKPS